MSEFQLEIAILMFLKERAALIVYSTPEAYLKGDAEGV